MIGLLSKLCVTTPPSIFHPIWLPLLLVEISLNGKKNPELSESFL
jgi:hypothetical protein